MGRSYSEETSTTQHVNHLGKIGVVHAVMGISVS